jgi:hypothetical protein
MRAPCHRELLSAGAWRAAAISDPPDAHLRRGHA